ncbi:MAG: ATP-dependent zinc metalloprotease FtsH [Ketobacteraceae bacterium]|nr:ATP-dependent zinc metalloprotease FtsH [Ketobacteraceae bacterium]
MPDPDPIREPAGPAKNRKPDPGKNKPPIMDWRPFLFTFIAFMLYYLAVGERTPQIETLSYSEFKQQVVLDRIASITIRGQEVTGRYLNTNKPVGRPDFRTTVPGIPDDQLLPLLDEHDVKITAKSEESPLWLQLVIGILPWVLIFGLFAYSNHVMRSRMGGGASGGMFGFGKSKARLYVKLDTDISFEEVAGLESAKQDLQEVIEYLRNPDKFRRLGAKLPKGMLMMGPPGTGKTLLAKATAAEAGVPFYSISGSEFVEMFVGVGASRVRSMFNEAREKAPALIFIDEIDSVGRVRGTGVGGGNDEREQTLNQILAEMDGFGHDEPVVVIAATNRPDVLDPALLRPGRFDRKVTLELPQKKARLQILQVHTSRKPVTPSVDLESIAARSIGFSGADLENLVNEAALHAARMNKSEIDQADFEYAHDKILLGDERKDVLSESDKRRIAFHECGHAMVAWFAPMADPLSKITIIPRGKALGVTETMPEEDRVNYTQDYLEDRIAILLGGRGAEKTVFNNLSSGAADDLKQATRLARKMVTEWGMSDALGPVNFPQGEEHPFLGMEMTQPKVFSDQTARQIDDEVSRLIKDQEKRVMNLLKEHHADLERLAETLIEKETLDSSEVEALLGQPGHKKTTGVKVGGSDKGA